MSEPTQQPSVLDLLNLAVDVAIPLTIFCLGLMAKKYMEGLERQRRLVEVGTAWRIEMFRQLLPRLNRYLLLFYISGKLAFDDTGFTLRSAKRKIDRIVYMNKFLWSEQFLCAYKKFISGSFLENQGADRTFLICANVERHRENPKWKSDWETRFVPEEERVKRETFMNLYNEMLSLAVRDIGILPK